MLSQSRSPLTVRAAAILTTGAVAATSVKVADSFDQWITWIIDFTLGSLTNAVFNPQVSYDGTNWLDVADPGALTLTADGHKALSVNCKGGKLARLVVTGSGTVTDSSATVRAAWLKAQ